MRKSVILICIFGSLIVGQYVVSIFYKSILMSELRFSAASEMSVEEYQKFPHKVLAEYAELTQSMRVSQNKFAKKQQKKLRYTIVILSAWTLFLLLVIVLSQTKALNKAKRCFARGVIF